jgi:hypothetical protein
MAWLIDAELSAARERELGEQPPAKILHGPAGDAALLHLRDERFDVVRHQIKLMQIVLAGWVDGDFRGRQSED